MATAEQMHPVRLAGELAPTLSRWLWLVKWLLAIPHYIVVGIFIGGGTWVAWQADEGTYQYGGGLVGVLVRIAVIPLLGAIAVSGISMKVGGIGGLLFVVISAAFGVACINSRITGVI